MQPHALTVPQRIVNRPRIIGADARSESAFVRARFPVGPADLSHETPSVTPGFRLTEAQRRALSTRLMLQNPRPDMTAKQMAAIRADLDSRVRGLPTGAFMALDSLRLLAEQGNIVARDLFDSESERLGLTRPFTR